MALDCRVQFSRACFDVPEDLLQEEERDQRREAKAASKKARARAHRKQAMTTPPPPAANGGAELALCDDDSGDGAMLAAAAPAQAPAAAHADDAAAVHAGDAAAAGAPAAATAPPAWAICPLTKVMLLPFPRSASIKTSFALIGCWTVMQAANARFSMTAVRREAACRSDMHGCLQAVIREPLVLTQDGSTYEKDAIVAWLQQHDVSPATGQHLICKDTVPNHALRSLLQRF